MNYRNVLKIYKLERDLSPNDVALLNTLRGMSDSERELFAEALAPEQPVVQKAATRKIEKCGEEGCGLTRRAVAHKDMNASGYHQFMSASNSTDAGRPTKKSNKGQRRGIPQSEPRCIACYEINDHPNHDLDNGGHQFETNVSARIMRGLAKHETDAGLCVFERDGKVCKGTENDGIHDESLGYGSYHEFQPAGEAVSGGD